VYSRLPVSSTKGRKIGTIVFSRAGAKYHDCSTIEKTDFTCMLVSKQLSVAGLFNYKPDVPETPAYAKVRYSERFCIVGPQDMQIGGRPLIVVCVYCIPRNILDNSYSNGSLLCQHFKKLSCRLILNLQLTGVVRTAIYFRGHPQYNIRYWAKPIIGRTIPCCSLPLIQLFHKLCTYS